MYVHVARPASCADTFPGIVLHLTSTVLLGYVLFSTGWTSATLHHDTTVVHLHFSPTQFCVDNVCSTYSSAYPSTPSHDVKVMQLFVFDAFCGTSIPAKGQAGGVLDVLNRAIEQDVCIGVMQVCNALLVAIFTLAVMSTGATLLCLTYWVHEHRVGRLLLAALVVSFVLHGVVVMLWTPYASPTFPPSKGSAEVAVNAPLYIIMFNCCIVLMVLMRFTHHLTLEQTRRYLNRLHVGQLDKHPLDCPASYA
ncbi:hypothetical protein DYB25_010712 [Aphanomyces astaci]|uniref:Uncharacterized protein n=1 Tax=Aphanomyces astaci TaxID=112090 RepID=A0A397BJ45_APHAT|nr:hypothetical protein DYB36_011232 [Aphanomyces astaci]RHY35781.1 hypothetical protein DYB25_010712 [Aphanomyces astaci]RHY58377.1 hypothetical protein DYB38_004112 [Aphanomyces astaci]RHY68630.1 hypothetical protein DYB34_011627 [Aphanomyces astaci]RHZ20336.1 hypothetical protein DYB31_000788 [Aphanomyces astaci]